jgi:hypothetical protein
MLDPCLDGESHSSNQEHLFKTRKWNSLKPSPTILICFNIISTSTSRYSRSRASVTSSYYTVIVSPMGARNLAHFIPLNWIAKIIFILVQIVKLLIFILMLLPVPHCKQHSQHSTPDSLGLRYFFPRGEVPLYSFWCAQTAPYGQSEDVNKMCRGSVWPRGVLSALWLPPAEDRGSSGRVLTLTGPSSYWHNHVLW